MLATDLQKCKLLIGRCRDVISATLYHFFEISKSSQKARKMNSQFRTRALSKYGNCKIIKPAFMGLKLVRNNFKIHQRVKWLRVIDLNIRRKNDGSFCTSGIKNVRNELIEPVGFARIGSFSANWGYMNRHKYRVLKYFQIRPKLITCYLSIMVILKLSWPVSKMVIFG